jgi:Winged helix DNA-binding domain
VERIAVDERRARLARRHRLSPGERADSALEVTRSVVALHSTDPATVFLSVHARTSKITAADIERELYLDRTVVRMLGMRRTLFVVPRDLVPVVHHACTRTIAVRERRRVEQMVAASGVSTQPAAWVRRAMATALRAVEERGEAFTSDVTNAVPVLAKRLRVGVGTRFESTQSAGARILPQLAMEGKLMRGRPRGAWTSGQYRWVPAADWLDGGIVAMDPATARAELLKRWLDAFGPGTEIDLRWWTGWTASDTRAALGAVPHVAVDLGGSTGYVLADDLERTTTLEPWAALLPTLDPTTMGWKERDWYLGPHASVLFDSNGNAGPTVWWEGRVVGGWSQRPDGEIRYRLLEDVDSEAGAAIAAEAARLEEWLGEARVSPGFLPPFQRDLSA